MERRKSYAEVLLRHAFRIVWTIGIVIITKRLFTCTRTNAHTQSPDIFRLMHPVKTSPAVSNTIYRPSSGSVAMIPAPTTTSRCGQYEILYLTSKYHQNNESVRNTQIFEHEVCVHTHFRTVVACGSSKRSVSVRKNCGCYDETFGLFGNF